MHHPVMAQEVIKYLDPQPGEVFVDGTLGLGGHSLLLLPRLLPGGHLIGIDQDQQALSLAQQRLSPWSSSVTLVHGNFRYLKKILENLGIKRVNGLLLDVGISSYQLERGDRGFSYQREGPLDMRMDPTQPLTAAEIVNTWSEEELARVIREYGEERWARRIARFIVKARERSPLLTTGQLVEVIKAAIPAAARRRGPHPAKRTFQALRIAVNDELGALEEVLEQLPEILEPGGRVAIISFHSLEDRLVKRAFLRWRREGILEILTPKPVIPTEEEIAQNPRARSAKLRTARRVLKEGEEE